MQGYTLLPGFVDIHIHGRGGGDFSDGTVSSMGSASAPLWLSAGSPPFAVPP